MIQPRQAVATIFVLAAAVLPMAICGCGDALMPSGQATSGQPSAVALVRQLRCPASADRPVGLASTASAEPTMRVPRGFTAVAAVQCTRLVQAVPGRGMWIVLEKQVATTGLSTLVTALRARSAAPNPNAVCPLVLILVPWFVLIGRDGVVIRPTIPVTGCAQPQQPVLSALRVVPWRSVSSIPIQQVSSQQQVASGCTGWKDMLAIDTWSHEGLSPSDGGPPFSPAPRVVRVCIFRWATGPMSPAFVNGGYVRGVRVARLLAGLAGGRSHVGCSVERPVYATIEPVGSVNNGQLASVELGGCDRVLRPDYFVGQATSAAIGMIESVGQR